MNEVYLIDNMKYMAGVEDKFFDLAIVDPPYGIGMSGGNVGYKGFNNFDRKQWDNKIPDKLYFKELFKISKNQIIFGGNYFPLFPSRCWLIWDKGEGFKNRTYAEAELIWTSFNANVRIFKHDPLAKRDYRGKIHPTQKPIPLYKWLLKNYAKPGHLIFDSHVGSGSSRIAAYDMGFDFIGCENDPEYWEKQEDRFKNHISNQEFFDKKEIQESIFYENELFLTD